MSEHVVVRNVYHMMAYAFRSIGLDEYARLGAEDFDGVEDLMAAILAIGVGMQRKRGIERSYSSVQDDIAGIRGHVDARATTRLRATGSHLASCTWDELSEDTYKNRVLKTVGELLVSSELVARDKMLELKRSLLALRNVGTLSPSRIEWGRLRYHRNNASYQLLMNVCHMVVTSMLLSKDGKARLAEFSDGQALHALYEGFVLEWFRRHHGELRPSARVVPRATEGEVPGFLPQLVTDVTLKGPGHTLIVDCKCYDRILNAHYGKEIAAPAHVNQIFSYVLHEAHTSEVPVSGMLLYALTDRDKARSERWVDLGHDFYLWTLDLGKPFEEIAGRLEEIATIAAHPHR